jgi:hypothetical protein
MQVVICSEATAFLEIVRRDDRWFMVLFSTQREQWSSTMRRDPAHHNEHKICLGAVFTALQTA